MTLGEVFLESLSTGVITEQEIVWLATQQNRFNRDEEATALKLGRLLDSGAINLGCRIPSQLLRHKLVLNDWIEPLGRRRHHKQSLPSHRPAYWNVTVCLQKSTLSHGCFPRSCHCSASHCCLDCWSSRPTRHAQRLRSLHISQSQAPNFFKPIFPSMTNPILLESAGGFLASCAALWFLTIKKLPNFGFASIFALKNITNDKL